MRDEDLSTLALLSLVWLGYFAAHSLLASHRCKDWVARHYPGMQTRYRLLYNLLATLLLIGPLGLLYQYDGAMLWRWSGGWAWLANGLAGLAILGFILSSRAYDTLDFLGLRQWQENRPAPARFSLSPWHRFVRHPWYSFGLVILWTRDMNSALLVSAVWISLYLVLGSRLEERKLVRELGGIYERYCERVPGLVPRPWRYLSREQARQLLQENAPQ